MMATNITVCCDVGLYKGQCEGHFDKKISRCSATFKKCGTVGHFSHIHTGNLIEHSEKNL